MNQITPDHFVLCSIQLKIIYINQLSIIFIRFIWLTCFFFHLKKIAFKGLKITIFSHHQIIKSSSDRKGSLFIFFLLRIIIIVDFSLCVNTLVKYVFFLSECVFDRERWGQVLFSFLLVCLFVKNPVQVWNTQYGYCYYYFCMCMYKIISKSKEKKSGYYLSCSCCHLLICKAIIIFIYPLKIK